MTPLVSVHTAPVLSMIFDAEGIVVPSGEVVPWPFAEALFAVAPWLRAAEPVLLVASSVPPPQALKIALPPSAVRAPINCRRFNIANYSTIGEMAEKSQKFSLEFPN